jgi:hypothetical protein
MPCARTHPPIGRYLCSFVEERGGLFNACLFTRRRSSDDLCLLQDYLCLLFRRFFRDLAKLVASIGKGALLISVYKSQWTWISAIGVIGMVMEVRVLGTLFTGIDGLWFLLLRIRELFHLSRESADRWWRHTAYHGLCTLPCIIRYENTWKANGSVFKRTRLWVVIAEGHCEQ